MNLNNLEQSIKSLEEQTNSLKGKLSLLEQQYSESMDKLTSLQELSETNAKSVELLNFVQKATKEKIKDTFENIVTKALQFIHQNNDYQFTLDFGRRGNVPELNFNIKTPEMQESHSIIDTRGGGTADVVSLALRLVLLEVSKDKGFLFLDEPFKHLDSPETIEKAIEFVNETQANTKRQIFIITHKDEVVENSVNPIIIKENYKLKVIGPNGKECTESKDYVLDKPKKRGRPKGSKNKEKK